MQAIKLPKGVIKHIDRARRSFMWKGNDTCKGINCLVSWSKVCSLKKYGGMGILDLQLQNEALRTKWLWKLDTDSEELWAKTMFTLYGIVSSNELLQTERLSSFLNSIKGLIPLYSSSIRAEGHSQILKWKWSAQGFFTTSSAYKNLHNPMPLCPFNRVIQKIKISNKVRIFIWIAIQDRLLTQHILKSRGYNVEAGCHLCDDPSIETANHILYSCPFVTGFWCMLLFRYDYRQRFQNSNTVLAWWWAMRMDIAQPDKGQWDTLWASGCWAL